MKAREEKNCTNCSYYIEDIDIQNLDPADQIKYEELVRSLASDDIDIDPKELFLLSHGIRKSVCIGGLVKPNIIKENCRYHATLPNELNKDQLLQSFVSQCNKTMSTNQLIAMISIALITLLATLFGIFQTTRNMELKEEIENYKSSVEIKDNQIRNQHILLSQDSTKIKELQDSTIILNHLLKK